MTRQEKINKIYEVIADKGLRFWNLVKYWINKQVARVVCTCNFKVVKVKPLKTDSLTESFYEWKEFDWEIIGHPVMIGDVLDWMRENLLIEDWEDRQVGVCMEWNKKRKPIDNQPDDCIDFIYDLIEWVEQ